MTVAGGNRRFVEDFYGSVGRDLVDGLSGEELVRLGEVLEGSVTDDFACVMVTSFESLHYPGLAGFADAWTD